MSLTAKVLENHLYDFKKELFNLRVQKVLNTLKNPARMQQLRKSVARVNTILNKKKNEIMSCQKKS